MAEKGGEGGEERRGVRGKGGIGEGPAGGVAKLARAGGGGLWAGGCGLGLGGQTQLLYVVLIYILVGRSSAK